MKQVHLMAVVCCLLLVSCQNDELPENSDTFEEHGKEVFLKYETITFDDKKDDYKRGDIVYRVRPGGCDGSIRVYGHNPELYGWNVAMIFDSSNPTGEDPDLGTPNEGYGGPGVSTDGIQESNQVPLENILIISEDYNKRDPDDSYVEGSFFAFDFTRYGDGKVTMESFLLIDVDEKSFGEGTVVRLYGEDDELLYTQQIPPGQDNEVRTIDLGNTENVEKMILHMNNSGAIDNIKFSCFREPELKCRKIFAAGENAICFLDDEGQEFNSWGWTNRIKDGYNGRLELWVGANGCKTDNSLLAGYLDVSYDNCVLNAKFVMEEGFYMTGAQLYAGKDKYPKDENGVFNLEPDNFPFSKELSYSSGGEITLTDLKDDIYLIATGSVCWE